MSKAGKFIIAAVIIVGTIVYLLSSGLSQDSVYYLEIKEVLAHPEKYNTKGMRVTGKVMEGYKNDAMAKHLEFVITDAEGNTLNVEYNGLTPDTFEAGIDVIVEGKYDIAGKEFQAVTLLTKCPSKYDPENPEGADNATKKG